ncbi:MAG: molecular chaperone DnaJ [Candidatus Pelagibacter sp. TMED272]|nr:molecular chaperone DnaJ [Pelagibacteraceae bacterium]RPG93468.1 MAG: molecular chaperone DnaJ [Candidatus Pelagibacter sp. TMED272]
MNYIFLAIIIFITLYIILNYLARVSSKKIASTIKKFAVYLSIVLTAIFTLGGKFLFSLPFWLIILSGLKIKGFTALQMFQLWRLIQFMKNSGRFTQGQSSRSQGTSSLSTEEAYKLLGLSKGCSKEEVLKVAKKLQKKFIQIEILKYKQRNYQSL